MERDELQVLLSKDQARKFARAIFADIAEYVENHREELEQLLNEAESEVVTDDILENSKSVKAKNKKVYS